MAELNQITVTGGIPSGGSGEVPTLAPIRDRLDTIIEGQATIGTRSYDWAGMDTVVVGAASAAADAVAADGEYELSTDVDCYIMVNATATSSRRFLGIGAPFTLQLAAGDVVHVIRKDEDGTLTILPVVS